MALAALPDWRWGLRGDECRWYPSMRLFRQTAAGDWAGVFQRIARAVGERFSISGVAVNLSVPIGPGELVDKITILEIKSERLASVEKLANVRVELAALVAARDAAIAASDALGRLTAALKDVNEALWQIEDEIRDCERSGDFGPHFIELARAVYRSNDERAALKRQINDLLGSAIVEEKSYAAY